MWCPECNREFSEKTELCPDCGASLLTEVPGLEWGTSVPGELLKKWPHNGVGEPEPPAFLKHCSSVDMEDQLLINLLEAYEIPSIRRAPKTPWLSEVFLGASVHGTDVYVPESMLEEALGIITGEIDDGNE